MRKAKQFTENTEIAENMDNAFWQLAHMNRTEIKSLTYFSKIFETKDYFLLNCYGNFVACISKRTRICYNAQERIEMSSEVVQEQIIYFCKRFDAKSVKVYKSYK